MTFLEMNIGKWMTQRTTYTIKQSLIYLHQSEITIKNDPNISRLNNLPNIDPKNIISSYNIQNNIDKEVIYLLQDLHQHYFKNLTDKTRNIEYHHMNKSNHICIKTISGHLNSIEKLWLVNPNLRLGTSIIKKYNRCIAITFSSDIRIM